MRLACPLVAAVLLLACNGARRATPPPPEALPSRDAAPTQPLRAWTDPPREDGPPRATQLSLGSNFACARMSDDSLRCWGDNGWHQLGVDPDAPRAGDVVTPPITDVVEVAAGQAFTCARKRDRTVWCWGYDLYGELGAADQRTTHTPAQIAGLTDAVAIAAGARGACAIRGDGTLWCWGDNSYGQLGDGTTVTRKGPVRAAVDRVVAVSLANDACAVRDDGSLWCWSGNHGPRPAATPVTEVVAAGIGGTTTCAVRANGEVHCWGADDSGQLGRGDAAARAPEETPAPVVGLVAATAVALEYAHACALTRAGEVWCWGARWAHPGFPPSCLRMTQHTGGGGAPAQWEYCPIATPVPGVTGAIAIDTIDHGGGCALDAAGAVVCWDKDGVRAPLPLTPRSGG